MRKNDLNGVYKLGDGEKAVAAYIRLGNVMEVSDPTLRHFIGQPLKTLVGFLENRDAPDVPWETVGVEEEKCLDDGCCSVGGLAVELGLYEKDAENDV